MLTRIVLVWFFFNSCCSIRLVFSVKVTKNVVKIPKCCGVNKVIVADYDMLQVYCEDYNKSALDFTNYTVYSKTVYGQPTQKLFTDVYEVTTENQPNEDNIKNDYFMVELLMNPFLNDDGMLLLEYPNAYDRWTLLNKSFFCVDYELILPQNASEKEKLSENFKIFTCEFSSPPQPPGDFYKGAMLVSSMFLLLVLIVYALLPELRNLAGKVLMSYVVSLFFAFLLLATIQFGEFYGDVCIGLTTTIYFFFLASFCWINVMSCDIWWTFRGYAKARPIHRRGENFKFLMYCIYGWGLPLAMSVAFVVINRSNLVHMPWFIKPLVPEQGCFIEKGQKLVYLYAPMLILIICNWIFFLMTAFNIWRLHRDSAVLDSPAAGTPQAHRNQRNRLFLYLKLSIIMGVNWILEVVSSLAPEFKFWVISDVYNLLMGLAIFLIFVCKKKIHRQLKARFNTNRMPQRSLTKSQTSSTTLSASSQDTPLQVFQHPNGTNHRG